MDDRRSPKRFPVKIRAQFTPAYSSQQEGVVVELGLQGCRIETDVDVPARSYLKLHLHDSLTGSPLVVELAAVRWVEGKYLGVEFLSLHSKDQIRLQQIIEQVSSSTVH